MSWHALTWLGDSALLLPGAAFIALWLALARGTRPVALLWVLLFGAAGAAVLVSKLAFMGWGIGSARFDFTGFSGHTALAASFWPVALWLAASRWGHRARVAAALAGWGLAAAIGYSRLALDAHSVAEVVTGYLLGTLASALLLALQHRRPHPELWATGVVLALLLPLAFVSPGQPAPTQDVLEIIATRLAGIERPYTREDLRHGS